MPKHPKNLTWAVLRDKINAMTEEQQNTDLTFFDNNDGEFCRLCELRFTSEADENGDVLDPGHPYLEGFDSLEDEKTGKIIQ